MCWVCFLALPCLLAGPLGVRRARLYSRASETAGSACGPLKYAFACLHVSLTHPGHRRSIWFDTTLPDFRWSAAMSARARMKTGEPLRDSHRLTPVRPS